MRGRGTWTAVLTWSIKHARRVDQAGNQGRDGAAVRGRERGEGGMAAHGGTARDCGALWQAGTVPRRHERSVAGREAGGDERESGTCWGGQAEYPDRRETRDDRRPAGGKRRVSLGPGTRSGSVWWRGALWPGRQVADVADLAAVAAAASTGGDGGRTGDGAYRQCTSR